MNNQNREFNNNPYYSPEKCGLEIIDELAKEPDYDFEMVIVWKDQQTGKLFWDSDSGCSCPTPFEDVRNLSDLAELNEENFFNFKQACENIYSVDKQELDKFLSRFKQLVRGQQEAS